MYNTSRPKVPSGPARAAICALIALALSVFVLLPIAVGQSFGFEIRVGASGRCLDTDLATNNQNGTKVSLWDCWKGPNQQWSFLADGRIVNAQSGRCLDAELGMINQNGTKVQLWDCWGGQNQKWTWAAYQGLTSAATSEIAKAADA